MKILQALMGSWMLTRLGASHATDPTERARRLVEEAIELAQAAGVTAGDIGRIFETVYSKPSGDITSDEDESPATVREILERKLTRERDRRDLAIAKIQRLETLVSELDTNPEIEKTLNEFRGVGLYL